jgi:hypothetical protein
MNKLSDIYTNRQKYKQIGMRKYTTVIDGRRIGIIVATKNNGYQGFAVNKTELDSLLAGKAAGRIDEAHVVAMEYIGVWKYVGEIEAEQLKAKLSGIEPRNGRYGEFYSLPDFDFLGEDAPF